jgi:hypothetical protein
VSLSAGVSDEARANTAEPGAIPVAHGLEESPRLDLDRHHRLGRRDSGGPVLCDLPLDRLVTFGVAFLESPFSLRNLAGRPSNLRRVTGLRAEGPWPAVESGHVTGGADR